MKLIPLTQGKFAIVDDEDVEKVSQYKWFSDRGKYAFRAGPPCLLMHRVIMDIRDPNIHVDHKNGDGLDNRRCNLRLATPQQNSANQKIRSNNTTGYKGVVYAPAQSRKNPWRARVMVARKHMHIGNFSTCAEATKAYDEAVLQLCGEFARPNFIGEAV